MYNLLLTIDISQVDSLAKMVNPDAEISSPSWWIYILGTCVFAIIGFLIKHYFKGLVLDGRPRPEIRISEGSAKKDIIYLPKSNLIDIDNAVAQKLQEQMAILKRNYSSRSLDVYQDMNLVFQSNFNNVKNYNDDVESYIEGMHLYYNRTLKDQLMSECYKKVSFVLYAKGKKVCNNLNVEISIGGENLHVFALNSFRIIINISALAAIHKTLGVIIFTYCILFVLITSFFLRQVNKCVVIENNIFHAIMGTIADKLVNISTIIVSNTFKKERSLLENNINKDLVTAEIKTYRQELKFLFFGGAFYVIMMVFIVYYTILLKITNQINVGDVVLIITLTISISNAIWAIMEKFGDIVEEVGELQSAFSIFDVKECFFITQHQDTVQLEAHITPSIEFKNVTFKYPDNDEEAVVFNDFSLAIKPGERVGIIGESGVGKTSIFSLLLKYFEPTNGEILINGIDINSIDTESLMNNISFIPQNITLFQRSIMDNLRYGHDDYPDEKIYEICKKINIHEAIMNMPDGYNTLIGEGGGKISGGQKQRIAIARAFIKRAKIVLLDEATSALDLMTEKTITDSLDLLYREIKPTVITISHKLHTVKNMDRIIVLNDGRIIEEGSHETLLANKDSLYAQLWKIQQS